MLCLPPQTRPSGAECLSVDTADHAVESCCTSGFYSDFFLLRRSRRITLISFITLHPRRRSRPLLCGFLSHNCRSVCWLRISRPLPDDPISPLTARDANTARCRSFDLVELSSDPATISISPSRPTNTHTHFSSSTAFCAAASVIVLLTGVPFPDVPCTCVHGGGLNPSAYSTLASTKHHNSTL
jgi:hypothetical protein